MQINHGDSKKTSIDDFRRNVGVLQREVMRQLEGGTTCCGVTLAQCHVLLELSFSVLSLKDLAASLDLDASTLSRTIEVLVQAKLVERTVDPADRRAVRLALSAAGRGKVGAINETCNRYYASLLGKMSQKDQRLVLEAVRMLADVMRRSCAAEQGPRPCCGAAKPAKLSSRGAPSTATHRATLRSGHKEVRNVKD